MLKYAQSVFLSKRTVCTRQWDLTVCTITTCIIDLCFQVCQPPLSIHWPKPFTLGTCFNGALCAGIGLNKPNQSNLSIINKNSYLKPINV